VSTRQDLFVRLVVLWFSKLIRKMFPRVSSVIRSPLMKASSPQTMQRRMLQSSAPYTTDHHSLTGSFVGLPYTELVALTRGFLTESGYREPEHRSTQIAQSLIDAFAHQHDDVKHKQRFMHSLASLVNDQSNQPINESKNAASNEWSNRSLMFEADYSVDQLLLDSLPGIKPTQQ